MHTIKPLDEAAILSAAQETGGIITLEEHSRISGLKGAVAETLLTAGARTGFFRSVALDDLYPAVVGDQQFLRARYGLDATAVETAVVAALSEGGTLVKFAQTA